MVRTVSVCCLVLALCTGCFGPRFIANNMLGTMKGMKASFFAEKSDAHGYHAGPALLSQLDGFIYSAPENTDLLLLGAELNCGYAMTFLDNRDPVWAASQYRKGKDYALRALKVEDEKVYEAVLKGDEGGLAEQLKGVDKDELEHIFWVAMCWGGLINVTKDASQAADLPVPELLMKRSLEIDESYYFGGGHLFFGMLYGGRTEMLGGDLPRGKEHYDRAMELTQGKFLMARVHYARYYAVTAQNPELYLRLLNEVLSAPVDSPADMNLTNAVARVDAAHLLDRVSDFFPAWEPPVDPADLAVPLEEEDGDLDLD